MAEYNFSEINDSPSKYYYLKFFNSKEFKELCECFNISVSRDSNGNIILSGSQNSIETAKEQATNYVKESLDRGEEIEPFIDRIDENGVMLTRPLSERKVMQKYGSLGDILNAANHDLQSTNPGSLDAILTEKEEAMERDIEEANKIKECIRIKEAAQKAEKKAQLEKEIMKLPPSEREKYRQRKNLEEAILAAKEEVKEKEEEFDPKDRRTWY